MNYSTGRMIAVQWSIFQFTVFLQHEAKVRARQTQRQCRHHRTPRS